jgi:hypothetical protein
MCAGSRRYSRRSSSPGGAGVRESFVSRDDFPEFMKHSVNRIAMSNQATPGVEGYLFDGEEYFIPRGVLHGGEVLAGTTTIHAFGGHSAGRVREP